MERKYVVVYWKVSEGKFSVWKTGLNWAVAKAERELCKIELDFANNRDINGVEIHSETVCRKHNII